MLIPKQVTVTSSFKAFGFREGLSGGTELSVVLEIPEGMTLNAIKAEIVRQKYALDVISMDMEAAKGMIPQELLKDLQVRARATCESLVKTFEARDVVATP